MVTQRVHQEQNLLPLVPPILLLIAIGIDSITNIAARTLSNAPRVASVISGVLALALFAGPIRLSLDEVIHYDPDPRGAARAWANALLPRTVERPIAVEPYTPYISEEGRTVTGVWLALSMDPAAFAPFSYLVLSKEGSGRYSQGSYDIERANLAALKARSCDYRKFPADALEPDFEVLAFRCN